MQVLTKAEEEIMQVVWDIAPATVGEIREALAQQNKGEKPPHSTISTMLRILTDKGVLDYTAQGKFFIYSPRISKEEYSRQSIKKLAGDYFDGSMRRLVSFMVKENDLSLNDLNKLLKQLEEE